MCHVYILILFHNHYDIMPIFRFYLTIISNYSYLLVLCLSLSLEVVKKIVACDLHLTIAYAALELLNRSRHKHEHTLEDRETNLKGEKSSNT
jgi:uncharacterized protein YqhQ